MLTVLLYLITFTMEIPAPPIEAPRPPVRWIRDNERRRWRNYQ